MDNISQQTTVRLSRCTPLAHQAHVRWGISDELLNLGCVQMAGWFVGTESGQDRLGGNYPIRFEQLALPTGGNTLSLSDIMLRRAETLWNMGKTINVLWSGGIDSTAMLVALMMTNANWLSDLHIMTTEKATMVEYPLFYNTYLIEANVTVAEGDHLLQRTSYIDGEIYVTGDLADQLFGWGFPDWSTGQLSKATLTTPIINIRDDLYAHANVLGTGQKNAITRRLRLPPSITPSSTTNKLITPTLLTDIITEEVFLSWLDSHLTRAPFKLVTVFDMMWWLNFTLKWSEKKYRMVGLLGDHTMEQSTAVFFDTPEFEWWAMTNHAQKITGDEWTTYKQPLKDFIYSFTSDDVYRTNKTKQMSLMHTFAPGTGVGQNIVTYWDSNNLLLTKRNFLVPPSVMESIHIV